MYIYIIHIHTYISYYVYIYIYIHNTYIYIYIYIIILCPRRGGDRSGLAHEQVSQRDVAYVDELNRWVQR